MKKVAILTFHRALNYGAKYQAYALLTAVNKYSDGYVLDYRCEQIEQFFYKTSGLKSRIKKMVKWMLFPTYMGDLKKRENRFREFDRFYKLSRKYTARNIEQADSEYDLFFTGSDQVWNPILSGNDVNYFLPFCEKEKRNSYAASLGKARLDDFNKETIKQLLMDFKNITVREKSMVNEIKRVVPQVNPVPVCDPVFLLEANEWKNNLNLEEQTKKQKYIFIYIVAPETNAVKKAKKIAEKNGWGIKYIDKGRKKQREIEAVNDAGPIEFLNLMLNAELVITTSFHALALSLIFHKPVQYELSKERVNANSRLIDLVTSVNMMKYEITEINDDIYDDYNWKEIDSKIGDMRSASIELLNKMIDD